MNTLDVETAADEAAATQSEVVLVRRGPGGLAFRRTLRDMVLIVASILVAFALDRWWDSARERSTEERYLQGVRQEFAANRHLLQANARELDLDSAIVQILALMGPTPGAISADPLAALFDYSFRFGVLELPSGSMQALLTSGGLALVSDDLLRARLAAWPSLVSAARNDTELLVENREELIRHLGTLMPTLAIVRNTGEVESYGDTRFPVEVSKVLSNVMVEGLLANRGIRLWNVSRDHRVLIAAADTVITLIDRDIGNP